MERLVDMAEFPFFNPYRYDFVNKRFFFFLNMPEKLPLLVNFFGFSDGFSLSTAVLDGDGALNLIGDRALAGGNFFFDVLDCSKTLSNSFSCLLND